MFAALLMIEPEQGLFKINELERLKSLLLNQHTSQDYGSVFKSTQVYSVTIVACLTNLLPVCCLMGFQHLLDEQRPFWTKGMASIWMLTNLGARIMAKYFSLLGDKRTVLLWLVFV